MSNILPCETDLLLETPTIKNTFEWTLTSTYVACLIYSFYAYCYFIMSVIPKNGMYSLETEYIIILSLCIDLFGQATLLVSCNYYTTMIKNTIRQKSISHGDILSLSPDLIASTPHMWLYIVDISFANLRYILKVFTNLEIPLILFEHSFPNMFFNEKLLLFLFSLCVHSASVYLYINYVINMKLQMNDCNTDDDYDSVIHCFRIMNINRLFHFNRKKHFIIGVLICIPILVDHYIIAFNTNNIVLSNINILTIYLFFFIAIFKPAYKWNRIILHFLLVFQSIILTNSHM